MSLETGLKVITHFTGGRYGGLAAAEGIGRPGYMLLAPSEAFILHDIYVGMIVSNCMDNHYTLHRGRGK